MVCLERVCENGTTENKVADVERSMNYWIAKVSSDDYWQKAIDDGIWLCQYRYSIQDKSIVTNTLNQIQKVKIGDILLLSYENTIYAYGKVTSPKCETSQISDLSEVIKAKEHKYNSGIVRFEDSDVFYEELEGNCENWGQRIKVEKWKYYNENSCVTTSGIKNSDVTSGIYQMTIYGITEKFAKIKLKNWRNNILWRTHKFYLLTMLQVFYGKRKT